MKKLNRGNHETCTCQTKVEEAKMEPNESYQNQWTQKCKWKLVRRESGVKCKWKLVRRKSGTTWNESHNVKQEKATRLSEGEGNVTQWRRRKRKRKMLRVKIWLITLKSLILTWEKLPTDVVSGQILSNFL